MKLASQLEFSAEQESTLKKACIIEYSGDIDVHGDGYITGYSHRYPAEVLCHAQWFSAH